MGDNPLHITKRHALFIQNRIHENDTIVHTVFGRGKVGHTIDTESSLRKEIAEKDVERFHAPYSEFRLEIFFEIGIAHKVGVVLRPSRANVVKRKGCIAKAVVDGLHQVVELGIADAAAPVFGFENGKLQGNAVVLLLLQ